MSNSSSSTAQDTLRCRICYTILTTTDELRKHLIDNHYEDLTEEEKQGIVV